MTVEDSIAERLDALARELEAALAETAHVERDKSGASLTPRRSGALGVTWTDWGSELQVETSNRFGGRWELQRTPEDAALLEEVVRAVVAGRVREVRVSDRSRIIVTFADGTAVTETGSIGCLSILPKPGWTWWGRHIEYLPYSG